jgi:hypothetical protein
MSESDLIPEEITRFLEETKPRGIKTLSLLGKLYPHFNAVWNTEAGKELLKWDMKRFMDLWEKIFYGKESSQERTEFNFLRDHRLSFEISHIKAYLKAVDEVKKVSVIGEKK